MAIPDGSLNDAERRLIAAAAAGEIAEFSDGIIRSEVIVALCCGERADWPVSPEGVRLVGGNIIGRLHLANRQIARPLWLRNANIPDGMDLTDARTKTIDLYLNRIEGPESPFDAEKLHVEGHLIFSYATFKGCCRVTNATITGQFIASNAEFNNPGGTAIGAQGCRSDAFSLDGAKLIGLCDINGAAIAERFVASGAVFKNLEGIAIRADAARIGSWFMRTGEHGEPTRVQGSINLIRAHILHDFDLRNVRFESGRNLAIVARGFVVDGSVHFEDDSHIDGCVNLRGADIKGRLEFTGSRITSALLARRRSNNPLSPASQEPEEHDTSLWERLALDLSEAKIRQLILPDTAETRPLGIVDLSRAKVGTLTDFKAAWPPKVDRRSRHCADRPCDDDKRDADHFILDGFEYEHLDNPDGLPFGDTGPVAAARIDWLHGQSRDDIFDRLRPQPWRQLGKVLAAQGYEDDARTIAIERRVAQRYANGMPRAARMLSSVLHGAADYGFNPWKAMLWSGIVILFFGAIYTLSAYSFANPEAARIGKLYESNADPSVKVPCDLPAESPLATDQAIFVRTLPADFVPAIANECETEKKLLKVYPRFDPLIYSLDVFLPLVDLGSEKYWRANTVSGIGVVLYYLTILEGIIGAVLLSLIVTGFTGLLTRDER